MNKHLFWLLFLVLLAACNKPSAELRLHGYSTLSASKHRKLQDQYFSRYCEFRQKVVKYLKLPEDASEDSIRSTIAVMMNFPTGATWEEMLQDPRAKSIFTEERRRKFVAIFHLEADAGWVQLKDYLEGIRAKK